MRVLIVTNVFYPDRAGVAAMATDLAEGLVEEGHEVTVRCSYPYYPEWRDKSGDNGLRLERTAHRGVAVERFGIWIPGSPEALFGRLLQELSFFLSLMRRPQGKDFDVILVFCPLIGAVVYARTIGAIHNVPVVVNVQDLPAEAAVSGRMASARVGRLFGLIQRWVLQSCEAITTISPGMVAKVAKITRRRREIHLVPNWLSRATEDAMEGPATRGAESNGSRRLLYAGNLGAKQGMVEAVRRVSALEGEFELSIFGDGSEKASLVGALERLHDPRLSVGDFLSLSDFLREIDATDWFFISELGGASAPFFPSKLVPVITRGCPVLAVCEPGGPLWDEVTNWELGIAVTWDQLERGVRAALGDTRDYTQACLSRSHYYARERGIRSMTKVLSEQLVTPAAAPPSSTPAS